MNTRLIRACVSAGVLAVAIVGCAPVGPAVSPPGSTAPSLTAQLSAEPTAVPSAAPGSDGSVDAPSELVVACDGTRTAIETPAVKAQADGIHVRFRNVSGHLVDFSIEDATGLGGLGDSVPAVGGTFVYPFGVGLYRLGCGGANMAFAVVDPDGHYTPADLACGTSGTVGSAEYGPDARGPRGAVLDVARLELRGLRPGDIVEAAGYPMAAGTRLVRVVRGGQVVAVIGYEDDGHGGWLTGTTRTCPGANITLEVPAA